MKFVKVTQHTPEFFEMLKDDPKKMAAPLKAHLEMLKKMKEDGTLIDAIYTPNTGKCYFIFDFKTESEIDQSLLFDPMGFSFDVELNVGVPLFEHIPNALKTME